MGSTARPIFIRAAPLVKLAEGYALRGRFAEEGHSFYGLDHATVNYTLQTLKVPADLYANKGHCLPGTSRAGKAQAKVI